MFRYDLLCLEGIVRTLLVFQGKLEAPKYSLIPASQPQKLILDKSVLSLRPHIIGAVLRGVTYNKMRYDSFIDLQDKLHQNLVRKRTLASVGTHDLDTIQGPFRYMAKSPGDIKFVPLSQTKEYTSASYWSSTPLTLTSSPTSRSSRTAPYTPSSTTPTM